jgi:hypothetical protein
MVGYGGRKGVVMVRSSDNWLLSELFFDLFGLISGWGWPVFIAKKFSPDK